MLQTIQHLWLVPPVIVTAWYFSPWWWTPTSWFSLSLCALLLITLAIILGIICAIWAHIRLSSNHQTPPEIFERLDKQLQELRDEIGKEPLKLAKPPFNQSHHLKVVFGRTVDGLLQQLIDLILRDFILIWLKDYAYKPEIIIDQFKEDMWGAVKDLHSRAIKINADKLIACDMVNKITAHFERIRLARDFAVENNKSPVFAISPYLVSSEKELDFIRHLSEMFIMFLLPRCYSLAPASHLLREVLACKVLYPAIQMITEPDYLNQKILNYLEAQDVAAAVHNKTLEYAKSFEDFLKLIHTCNDIDKLKQIRYNIVTEIMQATTLQNVNRARGIEVDNTVDVGNSNTRTNSNAGGGKRQIAAARKLKRYISQLSFAKEQCESTLSNLGWDGHFPVNDMENTKILPLNSILENVLGRRYFSLFLETVCSQGLIGYWTAVEELKATHRSNWHQLGAEIFYTYIRSPCVEIKVDKETRRRMEAFLLGDKGPEVFYEVQQMVLNTLHDKYYQSFLLSEQYNKLLKALASNEENIDQTVENSPIEDRQFNHEPPNDNHITTLNVGEHSSYARKKLDQLQERLSNKMQALQALQASLKPESKVLEILRKEVSSLNEERYRVEAHLTRAHAWAQHLGKWRATVHNVAVESESQLPQFVIVVYIDEPSKEEETNGRDGISTGWVLLRTLASFQELHRKLRPLCSGIKNLELPSNSFKFIFTKNDRNSLEKAKVQIQKYLEYILEDEHLNQSEAIYTFLSPSSEYLKQNTSSPKKSKFSFSTLFKSSSNESSSQSSYEKLDPITHEAIEDDDISSYLDGENGDNGIKNTSNSTKGILGLQAALIDDGRDAIAEPLYSLMGEVFDMRGVFKWLRKTLISFVQITYGRTINRQIRETIAWMFSESMLHYYISIIIKSWWPGGVLIKPSENRPEHLKEETKRIARKQFINNIPEILNSLVGAQSAQRGAQKIFNTLQNHTMNKQLFYDLFELLLVQVFPEIRQHT